VIHDQQGLQGFQPQHEFFVGIDSDGCAFDTMEIKQKECFTPNTIKYWRLQAVSKYAREAVEFVNLYSRWRGTNRWPALLMVFDLLAERPEVLARKVRAPEVPTLREWVKTETKLGNPALKAEVQKTGDLILKQALAWSEAVNAAIEDMVKGIPPFPYVRESLVALSSLADIMVVSQTPGEALQREWAEHGIAKHAAAICGQEMGTKTEHLQLGAGGKYPQDQVLMLGDAMGDLTAARKNGFLFFPINPGREDASWQRFFEEGMGRFLKGTYAGEYEAGLMAEFEAMLPDRPPWKR
jgi:phosphoglycolate phosphatase-like HAD superfamily hydrolase